MFGSECKDCVCRRCEHRITDNCCEMCNINEFASPNGYCDNDDVLIERQRRLEDE